MNPDQNESIQAANRKALEDELAITNPGVLRHAERLRRRATWSYRIRFAGIWALSLGLWFGLWTGIYFLLP